MVALSAVLLAPSRRNSTSTVSRVVTVETLADVGIGRPPPRPGVNRQIDPRQVVWPRHRMLRQPARRRPHRRPVVDQHAEPLRVPQDRDAGEHVRQVRQPGFGVGVLALEPSRQVPERGVDERRCERARLAPVVPAVLRGTDARCLAGFEDRRERQRGLPAAATSFGFVTRAPRAAAAARRPPERAARCLRSSTAGSRRAAARRARRRAARASRAAPARRARRRQG